MLRGIAAVAAVGLGPVDHVPPSRDVVGAAVLVVQVVGVLPHVDAEDRVEALHRRAVLVGQAHHLELPGVVGREPGPAGAELAGGGFGEGVLEIVERAEVAVDGLREVARGIAAAGRAHRGPEDAVVEVAAAVVAHGALLVLGQRVQVGEDVLDGAVAHAGALQGGVELVGVALVVLGVVDLHRARVDVRLERVVGVGEVGKVEGHERKRKR